jgi:hypothetical protein
MRLILLCAALICFTAGAALPHPMPSEIEMAKDCAFSIKFFLHYTGDLQINGIAATGDMFTGDATIRFSIGGPGRTGNCHWYNGELTIIDVDGARIFERSL